MVFGSICKTLERSLGLKIKNECGGECQQQFAGLLDLIQDCG
jgi:hypothetical protein